MFFFWGLERGSREWFCGFRGGSRMMKILDFLVVLVFFSSVFSLFLVCFFNIYWVFLFVLGLFGFFFCSSNSRCR